MSWARTIDETLGDVWVDGEAVVVPVRAPSDAARVLRLVGDRVWRPTRGRPVEATPGVWLDVSTMAQVRSIDRVGGVVHVHAGATWGEVEAAAQASGLTLGPLLGLGGETIVESLAGAWDRRPSPRHGWLRDGLLSVRTALPAGVTRCAVAPRRATGPDLARLPVGAGHRAGLITDVHLRVLPIADVTGRVASARGWDEARGLAMAAWRAGCRPAWWCLRRNGRRVELRASVPTAEVGRYDVATGAEPAAVDEPEAPLAVARTIAGAGLGAGIKGLRGAEVWDLRPEGATVYTRDDRGAPSPDEAWAALAERVFGALDGGAR